MKPEYAGEMDVRSKTHSGSRRYEASDITEGRVLGRESTVLSYRTGNTEDRRFGVDYDHRHSFSFFQMIAATMGKPGSIPDPSHRSSSILSRTVFSEPCLMCGSGLPW
jgi:hypothetical protein